MSDFTVTEHNAITNKIIVRDMTNEEIAYIKEQQNIFEENVAKITAKEQNKRAILDKLGLTEDEAKSIIG